MRAPQRAALLTLINCCLVFFNDLSLSNIIQLSMFGRSVFPYCSSASKARAFGTSLDEQKG